MPMLYDHSPVKGCEALCRDIQKRICDGNCRIVDLLDEKERTGERPEVFREEGGELRTGQYVGLFEYEGNQVTIASRFDRENPKPFFLWYLIENFLGESIISLENLGSACQKSLFDELLAVRLAVQVQQAWRKGGLRAYQSFRRNDSRVSGVIDVARHIRENLELENGRMAYRMQIYSLNNQWNVLFLQASAAARQRFPDLMRRLERRLPEYSAALRTLTQAVPGWEESKLRQVLDRTERTITNPVYRDWEGVRRAARSVLRRMGVKPGESGSSSVTGVFLDIDRLWERLLEKKLFCGAKLPYSQQPRLVLNGHMVIRPDFYFPSGKTVLDAKNRSVWEDTLAPVDRAVMENVPGRGKKGSPEGKWSEMVDPPNAVRDNVYQVLSYMLVLDCFRGGVVFPTHICHDPVCDPIGPRDLDFWRIPVCIPRAEKYCDFQELFGKEFLRLRSQDPVCRIVT